MNFLAGYKFKRRHHYTDGCGRQKNTRYQKSSMAVSNIYGIEAKRICELFHRWNVVLP